MSFIGRLVSSARHLLDRGRPTITWNVIVRDAKTGEAIPELCQTHKNVITNYGLDLFAKAMYTPYGYMDSSTFKRYAWALKLGNGSGTPAKEDTALFAVIETSNHGGTLSHTTDSKQYTYYVRYLPEEGNGYTYTECGIFENGSLFNHLMLSPSLVKDNTKLVDFYITVAFN